MNMKNRRMDTCRDEVRKGHKEYNQIGEYLAYIRHEILCDHWEQMAKRGKPLYGKEAEYYESKRFKSQKSSYNIIGDVTYVDYIVWNAITGRNIGMLKEMIRMHDELQEDTYFQIWSQFMNRLIDDIFVMPYKYQQHHIYSDLHYVYVGEYERLSERIGLERFLDIVDEISGSHLVLTEHTTLPIPAHVIDDTPIWTVGQAEKFGRLLKSRKCSMDEYEKMVLEWVNPPIDQEIILELLSEEYAGGPSTYEIYNSAKTFYYSDIDIIFGGELPFEDSKRIIQYIKRKIPKTPELHYALGSAYIREKMYDEAFDEFMKAKEEFEESIPEDFSGRILDGNDDAYHHTMVNLSFLYYWKGDREESRYILDDLIAISEGNEYDFTEVKEVMEKEPEKFIEWYEENFNQKIWEEV